jgi:hypothetical protein
MNPDQTSIKIEELRSATGLKSNPPEIPVGIFVQEALDLHKWCIPDREALIKVALDWKYAEEIPIRAEALNILEADWSAERDSQPECQKELKAELPLARNLRDEIAHEFYRAFRFLPQECAIVTRISHDGTNAELIQSLFDLAELGARLHKELLQIQMDPGILDKARQTGERLTKLQALVNGVLKEGSAGQELRNKAYYHLKEAVDEVRSAGQHVFWRDKERHKGYISAYSLRRNQKYRNKKA